MKIFRIFAGLALLALPVTTLHAQSVESLDITEALRLAYRNNPSLNAARADLMAVHESLPQAQAGYKPTLTAGADATYSDTEGSSFGQDGTGTAKTVGLTLKQPLYGGGRTAAATAAARHTIESRTQQLKIAEQDIFVKAAAAYMDVLRDQALLELRRNNRSVLERQLQAVRDRFEVGEITKTDVSQSEARLAGAEGDMTAAEGNLKTSAAVFEQVTGVPPGAKPAWPEITLPIPVSLDEAVRYAEQTGPQVLAAAAAHKASEENIDEAFSGLLPEAGFFGSWERIYDPPSGSADEETTAKAGIVASIPLYEAGAVRSKLREAKHTANGRYLDILEARRATRESVIRGWENLQSARAQIRSRKAQAEAARIAREGVKQETEFGARSVLDLLDADQELLDAETALVIARRDETVAQFSLLAAMGVLSPQILGFPEDAIDMHVDSQPESR